MPGARSYIALPKDAGKENQLITVCFSYKHWVS
jgi:hypothetical protein